MVAKASLIAMVVVAGMSLLPSKAFARETGFLNRTIKVGGKEYRYVVYVPADWTPKQKWPVILFLHGAGERGSDGLAQSDVGIGRGLRMHADRYPFIVVMPQCGTDKVWSDPDMEAQALAALEQTIKKFKGDRDRVYLTGLSMGGFGTFNMATKYPGRFAAFVPICGGIRAQEDSPQMRVELVDDARIADPVAETAHRIGKTPIWIFHGDADQSVPVQGSREIAEALRAAGGNVTYTEYPGVGHNSWDKAYADPELPKWLLQQRLAH
jgi:predicted peptidase